MAASKSTTPAPDADLLAEAGDLFGEDVDGAAGADEDLFGDADDLLNEVEEDDAEAWNPTERGEQISGVIIKVGETRSDYAGKGEDPMVPTVTIQNAEGKWRVIGFASVLRKEMLALQAADKLAVGNLFAARFFGEKPVKSGPFAGKPYKHYGVLARPPAPKKG